MEEIRLLDYGQRLISHNRNTFGNSSSGDSGTIALSNSFFNGKKAMGADVVNHFEIGKPMDALVISETHPLIAQTSIKNLSNTIVFSTDTSMFVGTLVDGNWIIKDGFHTSKLIDEQFNATMKKLKVR